MTLDGITFMPAIAEQCLFQQVLSYLSALPPADEAGWSRYLPYKLLQIMLIDVYGWL